MSKIIKVETKDDYLKTANREVTYRVVVICQKHGKNVRSEITLASPYGSSKAYKTRCPVCRGRITLPPPYLPNYDLYREDKQPHVANSLMQTADHDIYFDRVEKVAGKDNLDDDNLPDESFITTVDKRFGTDTVTRSLKILNRNINTLPVVDFVEYYKIFLTELRKCIDFELSHDSELEIFHSLYVAENKLITINNPNGKYKRLLLGFDHSIH